MSRSLFDRRHFKSLNISEVFLRFEEVTGRISTDPNAVFDYLREEDLTTRIIACEAYVGLISINESLVRGSLADFIELLKTELLPDLATRRDSESIGALSRIVFLIGDSAMMLSNPSSLIGLLDSSLLKLIEHPSARVVSAAVCALGKVFRAMPEEFSENHALRLLSLLKSKDTAILSAAASAWGEISSVNPKAGSKAASRIFMLLQNPNSDVRNQAVGYFFSLGRRTPVECAFALPVLREIRASDADKMVRERAWAAVQAISR